MTSDLVALLTADLAKNLSTADLARSLEQIRQKLALHWTTTHLIWFTDHGIGHAERVADYSLKLADIPNLPAGLELSSLERFILCAAALLHDIGMNDLALCSRPLGEMMPIDYQTIRHQHSERSGFLILQAPANWGPPIQDPPLAELVGLVAKAHGTKSYRATLPLLEERTHVRNQPVRGPLLAALLLMADELDLYYGRELYIPGDVTLNATSEAHAFKHRCVSSASVEIARDGTIVLKIRLSVPSDLPSYSRTDIERWIVSKLRRQMALIDPQIALGFERHVRFDRAIRVTYIESLSPRPLPSMRALAIIRAEVEEEDLIDHRTKLRRLKDAIREGSVVISGEWYSEKHGDLVGREDLYQTALESLRTDPAVLIAHSRRLRDLGSGEASDVLAEWIQDLNHEYVVDDTVEKTEASEREELLDVCISSLNAIDDDKLVVLAISCADRLSEYATSWLTESGIPRISQSRKPRLTFLITVNSESPLLLSEEMATVISTETLGTNELVEYLDGLGMADALTLAEAEPTYYSLKRIRDRHLERLQERGSQ